MENFWVIITLIVTIIFMLVTFYYSYTAKKELEKKLEDAKIEMEMISRPLVVMRTVDHLGASSYEADTPKVQKTEQSGALRAQAAHFSHFEIYNAGNSPAIGLEISLMDKDKAILQSQSIGFLRNNEPSLPFVPVKLEPDQVYYLVSEYESIRSRARQNPVWYQAWLPFVALKCADEAMVNVNAGELDFKEVSKVDRIEAFPSSRKPQ